MAFTIPTFNLPVNIWHSPNAPPSAPDVVTVGNLAFGRRVNPIAGFPPGPINGQPRMHLLLPAGTDVRTAIVGVATNDLIEVGAGTGRFYEACWCDDIGGGFPNEHRIVVLGQVDTWPTPMPRPLFGGPVVFPTLVGSGASADTVANLSIGFYSPPGLMTAFFAVGTSFASPAISAFAVSGTPLVKEESAIVVVPSGNFVSLLSYTWIHPGGNDTVVIGANFGSTFIAAIFLMPGNTFDKKASNSGMGGAHTVSSPATVLTPESAVAAFAFEDGTLPAAWTAPFFQVPPFPLQQTIGGTGNCVLDCGYAISLLPGVQTATETPAVPGAGRWIGQMMTVGP